MLLISSSRTSSITTETNFKMAYLLRFFFILSDCPACLKSLKGRADNMHQQHGTANIFEINRAGIFELEQKQVAAAAQPAAGGLGKNIMSPPPHSGWSLNKCFSMYCKTKMLKMWHNAY